MKDLRLQAICDVKYLINQIKYLRGRLKGNFRRIEEIVERLVGVELSTGSPAISEDFRLHDTSWRELITRAMARHKEDWSDVEACGLLQDELEEKFDGRFGSDEGLGFRVWTGQRIYFPHSYDGKKSVKSVLRNPQWFSNEDDIRTVIGEDSTHED